MFQAYLIRCLTTGREFASAMIAKIPLPLSLHIAAVFHPSSQARSAAWFVWDAAHRGPATLHRVSWEDFSPDEAAA